MEFDLNERIREVMESNDLSPSAFAATLGVSRPLVSHILSHRNKAGVELLQKLLEHFPQINAEWLLTGKGNRYSDPEQKKQSVKESKEVNTSIETENRETGQENQSSAMKEVKRVILFFQDGTFEVFNS